MDFWRIFVVALAIVAIGSNVVLWVSTARRTDVPLSRSIAGKSHWSDRRHLLQSRGALLFVVVPTAIVSISYLTWGNH